MLAFAPSFLFSAFMVSAGFALEKTQVWHPKTLDLYLFSFDASLHVHWLFLWGRRLRCCLGSEPLSVAIPLHYAFESLGRAREFLPAV
jgi:hypothetical protein